MTATKNGKASAKAGGRLAGQFDDEAGSKRRADPVEQITIPAPNLQTVFIRIRGTSPYVQNKFSVKAREEIRSKHVAGSTAKKGQKRDAKDFQECYRQAMHTSPEGWHGIPAPAFRCAMIDACRLAGFHMTMAKMSVFVDADGIDADDATPLVRITSGEPSYLELPVRNATGVVDLRARPKWDAGWEAVVRVRFDGDQFKPADVFNLMHRVGQQVGVGEGRPFSKKSTGMGWGMFEIVNDEEGGR